MDYRMSDLSCAECKIKVEIFPTTMEFRGQEICLFEPILCVICLEKICEEYGAVCVNCGEAIPPYSQVGVLKGNNGGNHYRSKYCSLNIFEIGIYSHRYYLIINILVEPIDKLDGYVSIK